MPRVTRKQADQHRSDILAAASVLFREHGVDGVSLPRVMAQAGLTHGAFYGHFSSKEALAAEACTLAFDQSGQRWHDRLARHGSDKSARRRDFVTRYASRQHRDAAGTGCPAAALATDMVHSHFSGPVRASFAAGLSRLVDRLSEFMSVRKQRSQREEALSTLATLVGAVVLARATKGHAISDEVLKSVQKTLVP